MYRGKLLRLLLSFNVVSLIQGRLRKSRVGVCKIQPEQEPNLAFIEQLKLHVHGVINLCGFSGFFRGTTSLLTLHYERRKKMKKMNRNLKFARLFTYFPVVLWLLFSNFVSDYSGVVKSSVLAISVFGAQKERTCSANRGLALTQKGFFCYVGLCLNEIHCLGIQHTGPWIRHISLPEASSILRGTQCLQNEVQRSSKLYLSCCMYSNVCWI